MKKRRIVIASILKPVNEVRMFEKMGVTLVDSSMYEVFIVGFGSHQIPVYTGIQFIPLPLFPRLSFQRWFASFRVLAKCYKVKPQVLIVNTPELLIVGILIRILFGTKIVYDVLENYYRNILYSGAFPIGLNLLVAGWVRLKEKATAPFYHHFILAEKAYRHEMKFFDDRFTIIENKSKNPGTVSRLPSPALRLLFTGTIAESTGIFKAIEIAEQLKQYDDSISLTVVGYCAQPSTRSEVRKAAGSKSWIRLVGIDQLVPHPVIEEEIRKANFGIVYYPPSPHTVGSMPTKVYEYMAHQLPILTWSNQSFAHIITSKKAGLLVEDNPSSVLNKMKTEKFYPDPVQDIYWEDSKFLALINKLAG